MANIDSSLVADLPLFAGLATGDLDAILSDARSVRVTKNSAVFEQGEEAHSFPVLLHGHLRAIKTPRRQTIRRSLRCNRRNLRRREGDWPAVYPATATAHGSSPIRTVVRFLIKTAFLTTLIWLAVRVAIAAKAFLVL